MIDGALLRSVRHNAWANAELIAFCRGLAPEQLAWRAAGTYGTLHDVLQHIVDCEHGHVQALTGEVPEGGHMGDEPLVPLGALAERARWNAERMERALALDAERSVTDHRGRAVPAGIVIAVHIHHGNEHRAHAGTILGSHGVELPRLDPWEYGKTIGEVPAR